jgi:uncharacterized membrane protein
MLLLEGGIAFLWICDAYGWRRAIRFTALVIPLAFAAEYVGVVTGFPFGHYHYTGALVPSVLGRVPAPITCAWLMIALGSLAAAHAYAARSRRVIVLRSALLAMALDACLEPTAFHVKGYWLWDRGGRYYGVPFENFAGWLVIALIINAFAAVALWTDCMPALPSLPAIPLTLFWSTVVMFATIDLFRGYPIGAIVGAGLLLTAVPSLVRAISRQRKHSRRTVAPSTPHVRAGASTPSSRE